MIAWLVGQFRKALGIHSPTAVLRERIDFGGSDGD